MACTEFMCFASVKTCVWYEVPAGWAVRIEFLATVLACSELGGNEASGSGVEKKESDLVMLPATYLFGGSVGIGWESRETFRCRQYEASQKYGTVVLSSVCCTERE